MSVKKPLKNDQESIEGRRRLIDDLAWLLVRYVRSSHTPSEAEQSQVEGLKFVQPSIKPVHGT